MRFLRAAVALFCMSGAGALAQTKTPATPKPAAAPSADAASASGTKQAQPADPEIQTTTATYGDWILRCQRVVATPARRSCEIVQSIVIKGQNAPFAQIAFGKLDPKDPLSITLLLPHNVTLAAKPRVALDEKDQQGAELVWTRCLPAGCFATSAPKDEVLKRWLASPQAGRAAFQNGGGQDVVLPISFRGLSAAIDGLATELRATP